MPTIIRSDRSSDRPMEIRYPRPLVEASSSAATSAIHDEPMATRSPAKIIGSAEGIATVNSCWRLVAPKVCDTHR